MLKDISWSIYEETCNAYRLACVEYDNAREYGYSSKEAIAFREADTALQEAKKRYPEAAAYDH